MLKGTTVTGLGARIRQLFASANFVPAVRMAQAQADLETARATHVRLLDALDTLPEGIVILDADGRYVAWNQQYLAMYPNTADLIQVGATLEAAVRAGLARGEYPHAAGREEQWLSERLIRLRNPGPRYEQSLSDGRCILIEDRLMPDGGLVSLRVDITEMKQREATFRLLFESNPLPMLVCRRDNWEITAVNDAALVHYGYSRRDMACLPLAAIHCAVEADVLPGPAQQDVAQAFSGRTFKHVRRNGEIIEVEVRASCLSYENQPCVLLAVVDITERRRSEHKVVHLARHDTLTGLPNRFSLTEVMQKAVNDASRGEAAALLFLDLDKFKAVNDTLGHAAGDALLREVALRLKRCVRDEDMVARLGGDEYGILLRGDCSRLEAAMVARRIIADMRTGVIVQGRQLYVGVSIGIAMLPEDSSQSDELFRCSDVAMYAAKQEGRGAFRFFEPEMDEKIRRAVRWKRISSWRSRMETWRFTTSRWWRWIPVP